VIGRRFEHNLFPWARTRSHVLFDVLWQFLSLPFSMFLLWFPTWPDGDAIAQSHLSTAMIGAPQELFDPAIVACNVMRQEINKQGRNSSTGSFFLQDSSAHTPLVFASILLCLTTQQSQCSIL